MSNRATIVSRYKVGDIVKARGFSGGDRWSDALVCEVVRTAVGFEYKVAFQTATHGYGGKVRWAEVQQ